jgi:rhamnose transport system substrate-binding protein
MSAMLTRRSLIASSAAFLASSALAQDAVRPVRLALAVARAGDDYFVGCREGALQAAAEVEAAQLTFIAPPVEDAARQAQLINDLVEQRHDAILVSPIASDAVTEACLNAVRSGLRVISFGAALPPDARHLHLETPDIADAMPGLLQVINTALGKSGEVAVLSTDPKSPAHQALTKALLREWLKPDYENLALITTVFAGGNVQKAYAETLAIVQAYPGLRGIIAPDAAALMGASGALRDLGRGPVVKATGIGMPSRLAGPVRDGIIPAFMTWSPIDVGYAAARIAISLVRNEEAILGNAPLRVGRLGDLLVDKTGVAKVAEMITVDAANLDKYADLF